MLALLWAWYWIHSLIVCSGTHDFGKAREFVVDPNGPVNDSIFGGPCRGNWVEFGRCRRCSRLESGRGFDY